MGYTHGWNQACSPSIMNISTTELKIHMQEFFFAKNIINKGALKGKHQDLSIKVAPFPCYLLCHGTMT